jgi:hypothetical protein
MDKPLLLIFPRHCFSVLFTGNISHPTLRILSEMPQTYGLARLKFISERIQLNEAAGICHSAGYGFCKRSTLSGQTLSIRIYKPRSLLGKK